MANMHLVTGYAGKTHVTAADHGAFWAAVVGPDSYILDIGQKFAATIVSNNLIRIADGDLLMQGRHVRINTGETVDLTIENGTAGTKRHDLIVARYTKSEETGVEEVNLIVLRGEPSETTAYDPEYITGDILNSTLQRDLPLYRIRIVDAEITNIDCLLSETVNPTAEQKTRIETLEKKAVRLEKISGGHKVGDILATARDMSDNPTYIPTDGTTYKTSEYPELSSIFPETWTTINISFGVTISKIIRGADKWVANTTSGIYYSLDGFTWTKCSLKESVEFRNSFDVIAYTNGIYIALPTAYDGSTTKDKYYYISYDGITWKAAGSTSTSDVTSNLPFYSTFYGVCGCDGKFYCRTHDGGSPGIYYSSDGLNWTKTTQSNDLWGVISGNGKSIAFDEIFSGDLSTQSSTNNIMIFNGAAYETTGETFDIRTALGRGTGTATFYAVAFDAKIKKFVCSYRYTPTGSTTKTYEISVSSDGKTWEKMYSTNDAIRNIKVIDAGYLISRQIDNSDTKNLLLLLRDWKTLIKIMDIPSVETEIAINNTEFILAYDSNGWYPYQSLTVPTITHNGVNTYIKAVSDK